MKGGYCAHGLQNKDAEAFDAYYLSFEPVGALEFVNEYSGLAAITGYLYRLRRT